LKIEVTNPPKNLTKPVAKDKTSSIASGLSIHRRKTHEESACSDPIDFIKADGLFRKLDLGTFIMRGVYTKERVQSLNKERLHLLNSTLEEVKWNNYI